MDKIEKLNAELKEKLLKLLPEEGLISTDIGGLGIARRDEPNQITRCFYVPIIIVMLQGCKNSIVGSEKISYREKQCLVTGVDLPSASYLTDVSPEKPMLAISIPIDNYIISQLAAEVPPLKADEISFTSMAVADVDYQVLDAFRRLVDLIDNPQQKNVLAPMIIREIHYRLLVGPLGAQLRMINTFGTQSHQIVQAINWLKTNYKENMMIDNLADKVNMAPSTFRKHFKLVTTLSPLQYQKRLRLYEAQRLMIMESHTAMSACYEVGYESSTQFNREYKNMFGNPPRQDIMKMLAV